MPEFDVDVEPIYVFEIDGTYLFKYFFERKDIFSELSEHYDDEKYRFEVSTADFDTIRDLLEDNYYEPTIVEDVEAFSVVKEQYTKQADILRNSVMHWTRDGYHFFVMQDPLAVDQAVEQGATRLEDIELVLGI